MSLLFPAYLAGLLGLALPWLLHRFSNQQAPEQPFPSTRFLDAAPPPVSRTRRLKYLGLLLLRILSLLLLCFLFAQPWLKRGDNGGAVSRHHLIALDRSLSMRTADRWSVALSRAADIADSLPAGDSVELLGFAAGIQRSDRAGEAISTQLQVVRDWQPGHDAADYGAMMQGINRLAGEVDRPVKLWLITDAQRSALPAQLNALYAPQLAELSIESVIERSQSNVHLRAGAMSTDGVNVKISAQLLASEAHPRGAAVSAADSIRTVTVQLFNGDRLLVERAVPLTAGELETVVFEGLTMPAMEEPVFTVAVAADDDLPDDDRVDVVVKTANPIPVTLLTTERRVSEHAGVFLATALQTDDLASVSVISGGAERLPPEVLHVVNGRSLADGVPLDILQFVDSGANVLLFNSVGSSVGSTMMPAVTDISAADVSGREMGIGDDAHPLDPGGIDWSGIRFHDVPELLLEAGDRVVLQTDDRQPILVEKATRRGRLLILNDGLDGIGSNLPLQPAFVELMHAILAYFDASTALPDRITVGERLPLPAQVQVLGPDGKPLLSLDASARAGSLQLHDPGLYKVIGARGEHTLQVVLDAREADIGALGDETLQAWQQRHVTGNRSAGDGGPDPEASTDEVRQRNGGSDVPSLVDAAGLAVWRWMLPLLLLAMVMETVLANRRLDVRRDGT